ncbi:MAG: hypothetical protein KDJ86_05640 [Bauldia sp.]|uniref:hypothetical protein n=1 Tax=Bauldia sp. TaxID=2575872 RepID=UPI001DDA4237|nr:hypothetical protein [Bauldia sp.]MCB1495246.1 hypothetical protein [Bauldia sp.]
MGVVHTIVARYPRRELEIRRLYSRDAPFRSVCEDYDQATSALRYWQSRPDADAAKIEDYRNFLGELETEILTRLDRIRRNTNAMNS